MISNENDWRPAPVPATRLTGPGPTVSISVSFTTPIVVSYAMKPMSFSLGQEHALKAAIADGHVAGETDELDHSVLIDGVPVVTDRGEIAIDVRAEVDVIRVQEIHRARRRA